MIRVVLDTVVFVRSLINPHGRWGTLVFDYAGHFTLVTSEPVVRELLEVLQRPELVGKFRALADRNPHVILDLLSSADDVEVVHVPAVSRDPKDDAFLATAKAGKADYLVSEDRDLLDLEEYEGIQIITAEAFLRVLEATP